MNADFLTHFSILPDPRVNRTKIYPLLEIVFLVISATISGSEGWKAIKDFGDLKLTWLRQFFPYAAGIPVDDTIARLMSKLNTKAFQNCFTSWISAAMQLHEGAIVPIDGKTIRRSYDKKKEKSAVHMVSAWSSSHGVVLGQEKTHEKSNEITAIPALLDVLTLKGATVTLDAMGCQKEIVAKIISKGANYVVALKGNQGNFHQEVKEYFEQSLSAEFHSVPHEYYEEYDKGHGRVERRQCWSISSKNCYFSKCADWEKIQSISMVISERDLGNKKTKETRFFISSLPPEAKNIFNAVR